jgi:hypothetical protein
MPLAYCAIRGQLAERQRRSSLDNGLDLLSVELLGCQQVYGAIWRQLLDTRFGCPEYETGPEVTAAGPRECIVMYGEVTDLDLASASMLVYLMISIVLTQATWYGLKSLSTSLHLFPGTLQI